MKRSVLFLLYLLLTCSCSQKENSPCETTLCTEELRSIAITITHPDGSPYPLDSFKILKRNGEDVTPEVMAEHWKHMQEYGMYALANDIDREKFSKKDTELIYYGYKNGKEVSKVATAIGFDCCHIKLIYGNTKITIKN